MRDLNPSLKLDFNVMLTILARCLLAYQHPYDLLAICKKKNPFITMVLYLSKDSSGGYRVLIKLNHARSRHIEQFLAVYSKLRVAITMTIHYNYGLAE